MYVYIYTVQTNCLPFYLHFHCFGSKFLLHGHLENCKPLSRDENLTSLDPLL